ncbi:MAG TPA: hypothetical protein VER58_05465 [Thermoanaerobaculia bacterium]|nr:hypothetical protein [Thermoanaerobaculia bacterium]
MNSILKRVLFGAMVLALATAAAAQTSERDMSATAMWHDLTRYTVEK